MYSGAMKGEDIYDDILYVEEEEGVVTGVDESRLPVAPRPFRIDDRGGGGESSDEDGSSEGYPDEEGNDDDEELDEDEYDSDMDDLDEEDSLISAWDRGLGLTRGGLGIRGGFGGARQDFLELSHSCIKEGGGLTTEFSFDVTPGRRRSTLHQTFTQSLFEETKQRQRQRDNFERERLRRAVFILQRGSTLKKKTEHEKTYKDRFLFLSNDLQSLSLAKSSQTRHKAKVLVSLKDGLHATRGGPTLRHRKDAEHVTFHNTTFSLHIPKGKEVGSYGSHGGGPPAAAPPPAVATAAAATAAAGSEKILDIWCRSDGEREEWLKYLPLVVEAMTDPSHGPRELIWSDEVEGEEVRGGEGGGGRGGGGGWVEGPRHYLKGLVEDLVRGSVVWYMDQTQKRARRRTRRSLQREGGRRGGGGEMGAAVLAARAATTTITTKSSSSSSSSSSRSSSSSSSSHLQNAMRKMHMDHLLPSAVAAPNGAKGGCTTGGLGGRERGHHNAAVSPTVQLQHPRSLHELLSFHAHPIKRPFHPEMSEGAAAAAVKAFRLVMQYMGDIDAVVQEEEQDVAGEEGREWGRGRLSPRKHWGGAAAGGGGGGGSRSNSNSRSNSRSSSNAEKYRHHSSSTTTASTISAAFSSLGIHTSISPPPPSPSISFSTTTGTTISPRSNPALAAASAGVNEETLQHSLLLQLCALGQGGAQRGREADLRNELYVALIAQTTYNPDPCSRLRGWRLLVAFAHSFMPSDGDLRECLVWHADRACHQYGGAADAAPAATAVGASGGSLSSLSLGSAEGGGNEGGGKEGGKAGGGGRWNVSGLAHHAFALFKDMDWEPQGREGGKEEGGGAVCVTVAELAEIQCLVVPASVFGCTLEEVLRKELIVARGGGGVERVVEREGAAGVDTPASGLLLDSGNVPLILQVLVKKFQQLDGYQVEGIFRRAAHTDVVSGVKKRLEDGSYVVYGAEVVETGDAMVVADLLKTWLRQLSEPLIPMRLYRAALDAGQAKDVKPVSTLLNDMLPPANAATLVYLMHFLNHCAELSQFNQMTLTNLAIVFSPNLLRHPSNDPMLMVQNAENERKFVIQLMQAVARPTSPSVASPREEERVHGERGLKGN